MLHSIMIFERIVIASQHISEFTKSWYTAYVYNCKPSGLCSAKSNYQRPHTVWRILDNGGCVVAEACDTYGLCGLDSV